MKKVIHVITTIQRGGAENQLLVLVHEQIEIGLEVHVVYLKGEPELESDFKAIGTIVHHNLVGILPIFQPIALWKILRKMNAIVHAHLPRAEIVAALTPSRFKLVTTRHNAEPFFPSAPKILSNFLSRVVEIRSYRVIAISEAVKDFLLDRGEILNSKKIKVVLYGYRTRFTAKQRSSQIFKNIEQIGTISRLVEQKDIPTMLAAFKIFSRKHPESSLSILGAGPQESKLKTIAQEIFLGDSVFFYGRSSKIYDFLSGLDAFILTSKYEGFGMVLLEAMDVGIPIIASNNSAIPEVLGDNFLGLCHTGDVEDFASKIEKLNDKRFRDEILKQQEKRLLFFDARVMCKNVSDTYNL